MNSKVENAASSSGPTFLNPGTKEAAQPSKAPENGVIFLNTHHALGASNVPEPDDSLQGLFKSIYNAEYFKEFEYGQTNPTCKVYSWAEVFKYNMLWWNIAFFLGLNFTHLDKGPLKNLTLDWQVIKNYGKGMWTILAALTLFIISLLYVIATEYSTIGILNYYIMWAGALFSFMVWNTKRNHAKGKELHIHHYTLMLMLMSFDSLQSPFASLVHAFCHGIFIEGGCRWGFDPIWEGGNSVTEAKKQRNNILLNQKQSQLRKANHIIEV